MGVGGELGVEPYRNRVWTKPIIDGDGPLPTRPSVTEPPYPTVVNSPPPFKGVNSGPMTPVQTLGADYSVGTDPVIGVAWWVWLAVLAVVLVVYFVMV